MTPPPIPPGVTSNVTLGALLAVFTKLGMTSFGGGLSGWMNREIVQKRGWMSEDQFMAGVALTQVMPGPNAVNLACFIGQRLRGGAGLTVSAVGVLLPPFVLILVLAALYAQVAGSGWLRFVLSGMAAAGVGMNVAVAVRAAQRMPGAVPLLIAAVLFVGVGLLQWPMVAMVLVLGPFSVWLSWRETRRG